MAKMAKTARKSIMVKSIRFATFATFAKTKNNNIMVRYVPTAGFEFFTGALSKKKKQAHRFVTRIKSEPMQFPNFVRSVLAKEL